MKRICRLPLLNFIHFVFLALATTTFCGCNFSSQLDKTSPGFKEYQWPIDENIEFVDESTVPPELNSHTIGCNRVPIFQHKTFFKKPSGTLNRNFFMIQKMEDGGKDIQNKTEIIVKNVEAFEGLQSSSENWFKPPLGIIAGIILLTFSLPWIVLCLFSILNNRKLEEIKNALSKKNKNY
jgi:hypothetical protein